MNTKPTDMNKIDIVQPTPRKVCEYSSPSCSYCKHEAHIPFHYTLTGQVEDWDSDKAKAKEQKSLIDFKSPKQDNDRETDQQTDTGKVTDVDGIPFQNLTLGQDKLKEEPLEVTDSLVPKPVALVIADDNTEKTNGGLMEQELRLQKEEEYDRIYVSLSSEEEESDTEMDESAYIYFG